MSLFTSSSKQKILTIKSLAVLIVLLVFYSYLCEVYFKFGDWSEPQSDRFWNHVKAQKYIYSASSEIPKFVFVGTSLTNRLPVYLSNNLAFDGGSSLTGLRIILSSGKYPDFVVVETNFIDHPVEDNFIGQLFSPPLHSVRSSIRIFREAHQPVGLIGVVIRRLASIIMMRIPQNILSGTKAVSSNIFAILTSGENISSASENRAPEANKLGAADDVLNIALAVHKKNFGIIPNSKFLDNLSQLKEMVDQLTMKGVKVLFHEMPMHCDLSRSPRADFMRSKILEKFPYIKETMIMDCGDLNTIDGLHLTGESGIKYAAAFQERFIHQFRSDIKIF